MFVTRASRRDADEIAAFYQRNEWEGADPRVGKTFIARQGPIVGALRLVAADDAHVMDDVVVDAEHRGKGVGSRLIEAAMNTQAGALYLACHEDATGYYERFGFKLVDPEGLSAAVRGHFEQEGCLGGSADHPHYIMRAR